MSLPAVTCPHCQTLLRSNRPIPAGINLRCPECKITFLSREDEPDFLPAAPRLFGPPFVIAVAVAGMLGLSIIVAALIYANRSAPQPVAALPGAPAKAADTAATDTARGELDKEKQQLDASRLLLKGEAALAKGLYVEAEQAFDAALKLAPDNADAATGLASARAGVAAAKKTGDAEARRKESVAKLLAEGKKAAGEKKYAAAVRALESARDLDPVHADVLAALNEAKTALESDQAAAKALADFRKHMDAGKAALRGERFGDAVTEYMAAVRLMPDDLEAQQGQKQAENKLAAVADKKKQQEAFDELLVRGKTAVKETRFGDAVPTLEAALRLVPDDKEAARELRDAKTSLKRAKSANAKLLAQANDAVTAGRVKEAKRLLEEAVKNWAEDAKAKKALANVEKLTSNGQTTREAFQSLTQQAALAMAGLRYADAVTGYTEALRLYPTDADILLALRRARTALAAEVLAVRESDRLVRRGALELGRQAFAEAEKTFRQALRQAPDNAQAVAGLSKARYGRAMAEGTTALRARKKAEAVRAFETALAEKPGDAQATNGLRQARLLR